MEEKRIDKLFKYFSYNNNGVRDSIEMDQILIHKEDSIADIYFSGEAPLSIYDMRDFLDCLDTNMLPGIKTQNYFFAFNTFTDLDVLDYYKLVMQRLGKSSFKLAKSINYETSFSDGALVINVPSSDKEFLLNRNAISLEYKKLGFKPFEINFNIIENSHVDIGEKIKKETIELVEEASKSKKESGGFVSLYEGKELYGVPIRLSELPDTEEEFQLFNSSQRKNAFVINGYVAWFDKDKFESNGSIKFILHDGESYVYCARRAAKTSQEINYFRGLDVGCPAVIQIFPELNNFTKDVVMHIVNMKYSLEKKPITTRVDEEKVKRVELHLHTKMSALDGVPSMDEYLEAAEIFGHSAIAVTDHGSAQSFHDLFSYAKKHPDFKPLYGVELGFVDEDKVLIAYNPDDILLDDATYVVFDLETTGFSVNYERIIEVSATKVKNGIIIGEFSSLVNPEKEIHPTVMSLTGISNADVKVARNRDEVLKEFKDFIEGSILVAHNAEFDIGHLLKNFDDLGLEHDPYPVIDTLVLARVLNPNHKKYTLSALAKRYGVTLVNHHRASNDARATEEVFLHMLKEVKERGILYHSQLNSLIDKDEAYKFVIPKHINLIAKTQKGIVNLYHLISLASTDYFTSEPILTKKMLEKYREGILVGSGCRNSYFFDIAIRKTDKELEDIIDFYDYIEVQPQNTFEYYKNKMTEHIFVYTDTVKRIIMLAKKHSIPVCATGDCHQVNDEDLLYRKILVKTDPVGGIHYLKYEKEVPSEYYMTTREMLDQFSFLGEKLAYEIVVTNTNLIADACDYVKSYCNDLFAPKDDFMKSRGIPSAEEYVKTSVFKKANDLYGELLPGVVLDRINVELDNIIKNKFSTIYLISQQLVYKSRDDGYVVGSRGSVGSSFIAFLMDITEVNSLPPHYRCNKCKYSSFKMNNFEKQKYGIRKNEEEFVSILDSVTSGYDLPHKKCPICGEDLDRDGHDIPFETFLGLPDDPKTPDIDLNFSGDNQGQIHDYIRELFGETKAFRAGTILTCKDKTAYAVVRDYFDEENEKRVNSGLDPIRYRKAEIEALSNQINGSKKTSSQHPGGIVVVPEDHEIYEVTPVQYPGDSKDRSWKTTHFDYHSFEKNLFKLDVLGHDDPTVIRYLMSFVKEHPEQFPFDNALDIPVNDSKVYQMMNDTKILGVNPDDISSEVATYGISEFGTNFVRGLLIDARPKTFADLVKVSGLSHGTDVWNDNAKSLVKGESDLPKIPFKNVIGCRDDIMLNLIEFGCSSELAFQVMEFVRKNKQVKEPAKWNNYVLELKSHKVPEWYIWSCSKIKYLFPKAHATAYVIMALRIAWFKLYRPIYFYSAILSKKLNQYDVDVMVGGTAAIKQELTRLKSLSQQERKAKEDDLITTLELSLEMCVRGMKFYNINLEKSLARDFKVADDGSGLYLPFSAIDSMGSAAADSIVAARKEKPFTTKADFINRTSCTKTHIKIMEELGVFNGIPDDNQMSLDLGI